MEINNNDEEGDNINRNLLINNNNRNNQQIDINRNNNNLINNNEEQENQFISKYSKFTFSLAFIIIIKIIFSIIFYYQNLEQYKYVYEMYSIIKHDQYYRLITRYLIHFGFGHLLAELFISYFYYNIIINYIFITNYTKPNIIQHFLLFQCF